MKRLFTVLVCLFAVASTSLPRTAAALSPKGDQTPISPSLRITGVPADPAAGSCLRFEVTGAPAVEFNLVVVVRTASMSPLTDPESEPPITLMLSGLTLSAAGTWTLMVPSIQFAMPGEAYIIEGVAIPTTMPAAGGVLLSWKTRFSNLQLLSTDPAPPLLQSGWTEMPGVPGTFPTTTLSVPDALVPNLFLLAETGPGGVYPIG